MNINRKISKYNFNKGSVSRIKYIVIHYVGALGGAEDNCRYYGGGNRNASAHAKTGEKTGKGVFTIVEVKAGQGASTGWGRLKSGAGWISLDYATRLA